MFRLMRFFVAGFVPATACLSYQILNRPAAKDQIHLGATVLVSMLKARTEIDVRRAEFIERGALILTGT